jgi:UDP-N-acetylglucosamine 1-carboxyvinyltransferase
MEHYVVEGGIPLEGTVRVHGAKNSALPLLAATLLAPGETTLVNCPDLRDIQTALDILTSLGCTTQREGDTVTVNTASCAGWRVPRELMGQMRASVLFLGALLARFGRGEAAWPGGCALGPRPIDLHLRAFQALGAQIWDTDGVLSCRGDALRGRSLAFPFPSVGATENAILAACGAEGTTEIWNAAREPEIVDLQTMLQAMGAEITGAGTGHIVIQGKLPLHPCVHRVMGDRIVAATYLCALAATGGRGEVLGVPGDLIRPVCQALAQAGCRVRDLPRGVSLEAPDLLRGIGEGSTGPYPAFPTDAQPLLLGALAGGQGETRLRETVFGSRFRYARGLADLGAEVSVQGDTLTLTGCPLVGCSLTAEDLRGGAALTIAALRAEGESRVYGLDHIRRGYAGLEENLKNLGGRIRRSP